jgi:hypothetical protein
MRTGDFAARWGASGRVSAVRSTGAAGLERRMGLLEELLNEAVAELTPEGSWRVSGYFVQPG